MSLTDLPIKQLDVIYNEMRATLGLEPAGKAKDKAAAIARIEKIKPQVQALTAKPKTPRKKSTNPSRLKRFNYPVQDKVRPPMRNGTKFAKFVDAMLGKGATMTELMAINMQFTNEKVETTIAMADENRARKNAGETVDGYTTSTYYRTWREVNNLVNLHGYGARWSGIASDPIYLFETKADQDKYDAEQSRIVTAEEM